jgi:hypothetical protein
MQVKPGSLAKENVVNGVGYCQVAKDFVDFLSKPLKQGERALTDFLNTF